MIRFRMAKINVDQFAVLVDTPPANGLSYTVGVGFKCAPEAKRIACEFSVEFKHTAGESIDTILKLDICCEFDIHPDDWNGCVQNNMLTVSKNDMGFLANQTVGAARGILFCRTDGTAFSQFILPPINLTQFITEDLVIDISPDN